ncbi:MAG: YfhO family protein [Planctomycetes bacterium]|nr:YfhO family protein [Planctomycetota bacterium]
MSPSLVPPSPFAPAQPRPQRSELALAALCFALLSLAVLGHAVVRLGTHTLGHWDMLASMSSLTRGSEELVPQNTWTSDPVRQMLPWAVFAAGEIDAGRWPVWNPFNGTGTPLVANYQSALFSPFQLPFYVLPLKLAVLSSALAKLWLSGFAAYVFLRRIGLGRAASAFGGLVFLGSGSNLTLLLFPHPGVSAWLPVGLIAADALADALVDPSARARGWRALARPTAALAATMGVAALSGHPETLVANALAVATWIVVRASAGGGPALARAVVALLGAAGIALMLCAPQLLPFLEYFEASRARAGGPRSVSLLAGENWPFLFFCDLAGSPIAGGTLALLPRPNHQEVMGFFVGAPALALACAAPWLGLRRSRLAVFGVLALALLVCVYDLAGAGAGLTRIVPGHRLPLVRLNPLWTFSTAALAAWSVERLSHLGARRGLVIWGLVAGGTACLFTVGAARYIDSRASELGLDATAWAATFAAHRASTLAWFCAGACGLALVASVRARALRALGWSALLGAQFASTVGPLARYTPASPDACVLPRTAELDALRAAIGAERVLFLGTDELTADSNCALGIRTLTSYDALEIARYQKLMAHFFGEQRYDARTLRASGAALRLFGTRYVSAPLDWLGIDTQLGSRIDDVSGAAPYVALARRNDELNPRTSITLDARGLVQALSAEREGLSGLVLHFGPVPEGKARIELELRESDSGTLLASRTLVPGELRELSSTRRELAWLFEPLAASKGRGYELTVRVVGADQLVVRRANGAAPGSADDQSAAHGWNLRRGSEAERGRIVLDLRYGAPWKPIARAGRHSVFEIDRAPGRAWFVEHVRGVADETAAFARVTDPEFDALREVVLEHGGTVQHAPAERSVKLVDDQALRVRFEVTCPEAAQLVVAQAHFPGWSAFVDGREVPLERANFAFCSVAVPAGARSVELVYEPTSLRVGLYCAALALLGLAAAWRVGRLESRER